jgi:indolepyruvate ferredoxin oxidoreductase beta subunit
MATTTNFLLSGVGGQGIILAADVVALVGMAQGYDVKKSEVHGMAQRGGSVNSHVRWGEAVASPLIAPGEVDYYLAFERLEGLRYANQLRPTGILLVNDYRIPPVSVSAGNGRYPSASDEDATYMGAIGRRVLVPAISIAQELGNARVNNVVMLGALSTLLDVPSASWREVICGRVPARFAELNERAFEAGREFIATQPG